MQIVLVNSMYAQVAHSLLRYKHGPNIRLGSGPVAGSAGSQMMHTLLQQQSTCRLCNNTAIPLPLV
jgi:hypothetical protein